MSYSGKPLAQMLTVHLRCLIVYDIKFYNFLNVLIFQNFIYLYNSVFLADHRTYKEREDKDCSQGSYSLVGQMVDPRVLQVVSRRDELGRTNSGNMSGYEMSS